YLSRLLMRISGKRPLLLSSTVKSENDLLVVDTTNPEFTDAAGSAVHGDTVHIFQSIFLWEHCCYAKARLSNYGLVPVEFTLTVAFEADFADIFEVRGHARPRRGTSMEPILDRDRVILAYEGLDRVIRRTTLVFNPAPASLTSRRADFRVRLEPHQHIACYATVSCEASAPSRGRAACGS